MKPTSVQPDLPCRECGHHGSRMEAERRDHCPVVCARCVHHAGRRGAVRGNGPDDISGMFPRMIGLGRRRG